MTTLRTCLARYGAVLLLAIIGTGTGTGTNTSTAHAQQSAATSPYAADLATELRQYGEIELYVFKDRADFLARIDAIFGMDNIKDPAETFAKLPRSPFAITGQKNSTAIATCHIFVPQNVTPQSGNEIFARLMRDWFGTRLSYASNSKRTYRWLIHHEARHCQPDHFGGDDAQNHRDEIAADLFAFDALATEPNRDAALRQDIIAFRMITSALIADKSHMIGLSIKHALETARSPLPLSFDQETTAFLETRQRVITRAKAIAIGATPTNRELVRAITELRTEAEKTTATSPTTNVSRILIALDDAVAHFAPALHQSVANIRAN